jgi:heptosyltransferase-2
MQTPAAPALPLIVRLRNWVGDVVLSLPTLQRLAAAGHDLRLVGKGWARDLLAGHGWPVHPLPRPLGERVRLLRTLRAQALTDDAAYGRRAVNAIAFPYSFSSALDMRLAGLRAIGHAREARGWLLARSVPRPDRHELEVYWHLGSTLLGADAPLPDRIHLAVSPAHAEAAETLLRRHALPDRGFVAICPFAGGTFAGQDKTWPDFAAYAADELHGSARPIVICPGPGEEAMSAAAFPGCVQLPGVNLGVYAALLQRAALMISNDTGPGHLAAAVGTPLVSVLGPSDPAQWRAWGPRVHLVQGRAGWPTRDAVHDAVSRLLGG